MSFQILVHRSDGVSFPVTGESDTINSLLAGLAGIAEVIKVEAILEDGAPDARYIRQWRFERRWAGWKRWTYTPIPVPPPAEEPYDWRAQHHRVWGSRSWFPDRPDTEAEIREMDKASLEFKAMFAPTQEKAKRLVVIKPPSRFKS